MKCPGCSGMENKVIDSRLNKEGNVIRRRRECLSCTDRFTTYEKLERSLPLLIKKDGINGAALATISAQISTSLIYTYLKKDSRILFFMFLKCFDARRIFQRKY